MFETGVKLGLEIFDSQEGISKITTRIFMPFAPHTQCSALGRNLAPQTDNRAIGVVGFDCKKEIDDFSLLAEHYEIPVVSYGAADPGLDKKALYPFLLRSIPSDRNLYATMADQIVHTEFDGVGLLIEETEYGEKSREVFEKRIVETAPDKKIVKVESFPIPARKDDVKAAIKRLTGDDSVNLVGIVVRDVNSRVVIESLQELPLADVPRIIAPHPFSEHLNISNAARFRDMIVVRHMSRGVL